MSKQLTVSATLSLLALAATALVMGFSEPTSGSARGATAHGSLVSVLLRA